MKYRCVSCDFNTDHKTKYTTHLKTVKHLSQITPMDERDIEIQKLREEVAYLKGKLEVYEKLNRRAEIVPKEEKEVVVYDGPVEDCLTVWNKYRATFELDLKDEPTIEALAELRAMDDEVGEVTHENFIEAFVSNEANSLHHLKVMKDYADGDANAIHDFMVDIFKECKMDITEKYKGRFRLFHNGEWHSVEDSRELYTDFVCDVALYFKNCIKALKYYYAFNSQEKKLGDYEMIKPITTQILNRMNYTDPDERRKYIINKVSS